MKIKLKKDLKIPFEAILKKGSTLEISHQVKDIFTGEQVYFYKGLRIPCKFCKKIKN
jgi:hypothetical protein